MLKARHALVLGVVALVGSGCWEQNAPDWFAQMKEQPAVQALENVPPLMPPAGTIPLGGLEPRIDHPAPAFMAMGLPNPIPADDASIARGEYVYGIYCSVCHGADGMADLDKLPVAKKLAEYNAQPVPLAATAGYPDGYIFTKIRYGKPTMPGYPQIPPEDRWHVVNYLRKLMKKGN